MTAPTRRYGDGASYPIPLWSGVLEHRKRIGAAIWEFIWFLDKITLERDGVGLVLGGQPIRAVMIAVQIGKSERRARAAVEHLESAGYIRRRRTPVGYVIEVLNSRKFGIWKRPVVTAENVRSDGRKRPIMTAENVRSNKDTAVRDAAETQQQRAAASTNLQAWIGIGLDHPVGDGPFRQFWETTWASRNGKPLSHVMGDAADAWQARGGRVSPQFFRALAEIRNRERQAKRTDEREVVPLEVPD
jgi:hypothetical protein